jgi:hypothetical protein
VKIGRGKEEFGWMNRKWRNMSEIEQKFGGRIWGILWICILFLSGVDGIGFFTD